MEIKDVQKKERLTKIMSIRTTPKVSEWMNKNNVSPTVLFNKAVKELMEK